MSLIENLGKIKIIIPIYHETAIQCFRGLFEESLGNREVMQCCSVAAIFKKFAYLVR